jgi:hypothetical protein
MNSFSSIEMSSPNEGIIAALSFFSLHLDQLSRHVVPLASRNHLTEIIFKGSIDSLFGTSQMNVFNSVHSR